MYTLTGSVLRCVAPRSTAARGKVPNVRRVSAAHSDEVQTAIENPFEHHPSLQPPSQDPFRMASRRLHSVLKEAGVRNEEDLVSAEVADYPAEEKLTVCTNMASFATLGATAACWFCGEDPLGGLTLSEDSMHAALLGLAYGTPLLACSWLSRTKIAREWFPVLEDLHVRQTCMFAPLITGLAPSQMLILLVCTVVPVLLCLLPAMKGGLDMALLLLYVSSIQPAGIHVSSSMAAGISTVLPLLVSAYVAGWLTMEKLSVKHTEYYAIKSALATSKQHFHVLAMNARSTSTESKQAAEAFKIIAVLWLMSRIKTAQLGYVLTALTIAYFGVVWQQTGNLATPAMAALLYYMLELHYIHRDANNGQEFVGRKASESEV